MWLFTRVSGYMARHKGLPTMLAIALVALNFMLQFFPFLGWLASSNLLLHLGIIIGLSGLLLSAALG